jgi:hypothetical protein
MKGFLHKHHVFFPVEKTDQRGMDCFPNAVNFLLREPLFTSREQICRLIEKNQKKSFEKACKMKQKGGVFPHFFKDFFLC